MPDNLTNITVPTPAGRKPTVRVADWKTIVQQYTDLNAPHVEYRFATGKTFLRRDGQSGIYN